MIEAQFKIQVLLSLLDSRLYSSVYQLWQLGEVRAKLKNAPIYVGHSLYSTKPDENTSINCHFHAQVSLSIQLDPPNIIAVGAER